MAGATGQGKSVGLNAVLTALLKHLPKLNLFWLTQKIGIDTLIKLKTLFSKTS
jgi:predicted GTPase